MRCYDPTHTCTNCSPDLFPVSDPRPDGYLSLQDDDMEIPTPYIVTLNGEPQVSWSKAIPGVEGQLLRFVLHPPSGWRLAHACGLGACVEILHGSVEIMERAS